MYLAAVNELTLSFTAQSGSTLAGIGEKLTPVAGNKVQVQLNGKGYPVGSVITLIGEKGIISTKKAESSKISFSWNVIPSLSKYFRIEVRTQDGDMLALTNPIWLH